MYQLKQQPEDFKVYEQNPVEVSKEIRTHSIWKLQKKEYTTPRAIEIVASALGIPAKFMGYAGNKDKKAITKQMISIKKVSKDKIARISLRNIELEFIGYSEKPISLGELEGNQFEITVRNVESKPKELDKFLNLFGEQRFSENNAEIGKLIVKRDFEKAVNVLIQGRGRQEQRVKEFLEKNQKDFVGSIRQISKKILKLYVHSYQSKLWNETVTEYVEKGISKENVSMIGFEIAEKDDVITSIMEKEDITERDFVIREIPELSSEGVDRPMYCSVKGLEIGELEKDELNSGMYKVLVKFSLRKGSYATECIKDLFKK